MSTEMLFREDAYLSTATAEVRARGERGIELSRTVFYPLGGGQAGDSGLLRRADGRTLAITDTRKGEGPGSIVHLPAAGAELPQVGETVTLELDWPRRYRLMRLHTALHLLSCVVPAPVTGGNIVPQRGRLDFDIELSRLDAQAIERATNALIAKGAATQTVWISDDELAAQPQLVKTMSVQPPRGSGRVRLLQIPGIDLQPCGGTHVADIGEIGPIRVVRIRNEGKHNKRIEIVLASGSD